MVVLLFWRIYVHCPLLSIDLRIEYSYQKLLQQRVSFGCMKRVDFPALSYIFRKLAPRNKDALVHYPIAVSCVDKVNNINVISFQHLSSLLVFCCCETVIRPGRLISHLFALGYTRKVASTLNSYSTTDAFPCFQIIGVRSEMFIEPSVHPAHNERTALPLMMIALLLTGIASHCYSCCSSKALPIPLHALEWVVCPVRHASGFLGVQVWVSYDWGRRATFVFYSELAHRRSVKLDMTIRSLPRAFSMNMQERHHFFHYYYSCGGKYYYVELPSGSEC